MYILNFIKNRNIQRKFTSIFYSNSFEGSVSKSGPGSDLVQTQVIRDEIPKLLIKYKIKSLIDAPCGDFYWMQLLYLENVNYVGIDIVEEIIKINSQRFQNPLRKFICKNIITDKLPDADLILIRDCWVHLTTKDVFSCIKNLKQNNIRYLLTTSFTNLETNLELDNIWRPLNLGRAPFNFPKPMETIIENCTENDGIYSDKSLLLWEISNLPYH
jgi:hypothetical protein